MSYFTGYYFPPYQSHATLLVNPLCTTAAACNTHHDSSAELPEHPVAKDNIYDNPLVRHMSTDSNTIRDASAEETATANSEGTPTTAPQAHCTTNMEESQDPATSTPQASSDIPPVGAETERQTASKTEEPREKVPLTEQDIYLLADAVIADINRLQTAMEALQEYVNTQLDGPEEKPLYQWEQYTGYCGIGLAISSLGLAVAELEPAHLPEFQASSYRRRARAHSTAISKIAIFILGHMNKKCATCMDEIEASNLDAEGKQAAHTHITREVSRVLEYCSRATTRIWQAFDHLEERLQPIPCAEIAATVDATVRHTIASMLDTYERNHTAEYNNRVATEPSAHYSRMMALFWLAVTLGCVYLTIEPFVPAASSSLLRTPSRQPNHAIYHQTVHLVERTNAVTNLTAALYTVQLAELDSRYRALELTAESNGLRIDNLVEALGPPNQMGTYYAAVANGDVEGVRRRVQKMQEDVEWRFHRLQNEMQQMRKNVNRMDIRLTKRLDKVGGR